MALLRTTLVLALAANVLGLEQGAARIPQFSRPGLPGFFPGILVQPSEIGPPSQSGIEHFLVPTLVSASGAVAEPTESVPLPADQMSGVPGTSTGDSGNGGADGGSGGAAMTTNAGGSAAPDQMGGNSIPAATTGRPLASVSAGVSGSAPTSKSANVVSSAASALSSAKPGSNSSSISSTRGAGSAGNRSSVSVGALAVSVLFASVLFVL